MYVDKCTAHANGKTYTRYLLRESRREGKKTGNRSRKNVRKLIFFVFGNLLFLSSMRPEYQHQLDDLLRKIEQLEAVVRSQQQTIVTQQQAIEVQQERINQLESALAAAKKNSSNSSMPPSSDIVKPKKTGTSNKDNAQNQDGNNQDGNALFDAKLTAIVAYMKCVCHASYSTIRKFLRDVIGVRVARSFGERLREGMRELFEIIHLHDSCDASFFTALLQARKSLILTDATTNVPIVPPAQ